MKVNLRSFVQHTNMVNYIMVVKCSKDNSEVVHSSQCDLLDKFKCIKKSKKNSDS